MKQGVENTYELTGPVKGALDQELARLPRGEVSEQETRYPNDARSMRAFLEVFFTRHLFQLQNSLTDYIASDDFFLAMRSGVLNVLDIGSGPAVASQALIEMVESTMGSGDSHASESNDLFRIVHVLNDTSPICLMTGRRMLSTCSECKNGSHSSMARPQVFMLSSAFPGNTHQIHRVASFLGGFDLVILSYVLRPLIRDGNLRRLVCGVNTLECFCKSRGRVLIIQDKFQEPLICRLAGILRVECREQTLTQRIYPPRGNNEVCSYTYFDCLYAPRERQLTTSFD